MYDGLSLPSMDLQNNNGGMALYFCAGIIPETTKHVTQILITNLY